MAAEVERRRGRKRRKGHTSAKLWKGEKVEVRFVEDGLKGSWHAATILDCDQCTRLVEYDEMMDEDCSSKLVESVTVSAAVEGLTCTVPEHYRGNIRPLLARCGVDQAVVTYGVCVDAFVDDAWWEGVIFDHHEASPRRLVFFPDEGDQQIIPVTQLRLSLDWNEVTGAWSPRGTWSFLELLQKLEHEEPLPVSVRQIWYDVRSHSSFAGSIGDWVFGSWLSWNELVSEVVNEILSVSFGLTVPEVLVDFSSHTGGIHIPTKALPFSESNNVCSDEAGFAVANQSTGLQGMPSQPDSEFTENSWRMICEGPSTDDVLDVSARRICERSSLSPPGKKETMEKLGHSFQVLSDFIFEHHRRKTSCLPESRNRYKVLRNAAISHLLAVGWKLKCTTSGVKFYVSPYEKRYYSFIKACEAWEMIERQGSVNCNGVNENLLCSAEYTGNMVQTAEGDEDAHKLSRDAESWQPLDLEPEYFPEAMGFCARGLFSGRHENKETDNRSHINAKRKFMKHLLALGWRVETKQGTFRYRSPDGRSFYSIQRIYREMAEGHKKRRHSWRKDVSISANISGESLGALLTDIHPESGHGKSAINLYLAKECLGNHIKTTRSSFMKMLDSNSMVYAIKTSCSESIKQGQTVACGRGQFPKENGYASKQETPLHGVLSPDYDPEAISDYIHYNESRKRKHKKGKNCLVDHCLDDVSVTREKVRKHLFSEGWTVWARPKKDRKEKCYRSPNGRGYYSLHTACKAYMKGKDFQITTVRSGGHLMKCKQYEGWSAEDDLSECNKNNPQLNVYSSSVDRLHGGKWEAMDLSHDRADYGSAIFSRPSQYGKVHHSAINGRGTKKMKNKKLNATFSSSSLSLCQKIIKHSFTQKKSNCKSGNGKSSLIKQCDVSRSDFLQRVLRSSKRARFLASSPGRHVSRTILTLLIDNNVVLPREKVYYMRQRDGHVMKEGRITRDGIKCKCCKVVFTISDFEAHAGSSKHRPAANIFLQDGRTLLQCKAQIRDKSKPKEFPHKRKKRDYSSYQSDSICSVCQDGGSLVLCDHCPSSFHLECVGLEEVPEGKWFCPSCRCGICGLSEFNCDSEFSEKTVIYCDQCEREYHVGCLRRKGLAGLESCPEGNWFCSESCSKIFTRLHGLLGKTNPTTADGFSWSILRSRKESDPDPDAYDMETIIEHHCKLSVAAEVMHECFEPITEPRNNGDLVTDIIFNKESELNRLNFWGFYTMLLQRGDELISVATFRVFGEKVAEMPLVGTRVQYRRKGMCRLLMDELEKLLSSLGVERLLLPAIPQLLETWTASFGFSKMTHSERLMLSEFTPLSFQDTTMCQKLLRSSPATLKETKDTRWRSHDILLETPNVGVDFNSVISEAVETVEPIKSLPLSADEEPYPMSTDCPSIGEVKYLTDAAHSPNGSHCPHLLGLTQEEDQTIQSEVPERRPDNASSGKCSDGCPTVEMPPPSIMDKQLIDLERRFTGKCYVRGKNRTGRELSRSTYSMYKAAFNDETLKHFYKRRVAAT